MTNRTLTISICLAVLLAGLAWVTRPKGRDVPMFEAAEMFMLQLDVPSITSVRVEADGYEAEVFKDRGWMISLPADESGIDPDLPRRSKDFPHQWPAEEDAVRLMLRELATMPLETSEKTGSSTALVSVQIISSSQTVTLEVVGRPLAGRIPLRITSDTGVRHALAPADRFRPLSVEHIAALAEPRPFATDGVIVQMTITPMAEGGLSPMLAGLEGEPGVSLIREAGLWTLPDTDARIDQAAAVELAEMIGNIRVSGVTVPVVGLPAHEVVYVVEVRAAHPRRPGEDRQSSVMSLRIGHQRGIDGGVAAFAERHTPGTPGVWGMFTLEADTFPSLPADPVSLLDPVPLPWPSGEAASITITRAGSTAVMSRTLDGWTADDRPADTLAIDTLLSLLGSAHPVRLHSEIGSAASEIITLVPVGTGSPVKLLIARVGPEIIVTDGSADWVIDDAEGLLGRSLDSLLPPDTAFD